VAVQQEVQVFLVDGVAVLCAAMVFVLVVAMGGVSSG
jgi:hypothetical protein